MPRALGCVDQCHRAVSVSRTTDFRHRIDPAERVRDVRECDDSNRIISKDRLELRPIDFSLVSGHSQEMELGSETSGEILPRDQIGVMFHLREQNAITWLEFVAS